MSGLLIDGIEFCRRGESREGEAAVADLRRLREETADSSGLLQWSLQGAIGRLGHPRMTLSVRGEVQLICQRCLSPFAFEVDSAATIVLAPSDEAADEIEAQLEDGDEGEDVEVIVAGSTLDVLTLVEDEALLALPLSARHAQCPDQPAAAAPEDDRRESPFSVLKDLKR
ncbi:MAG: YceD family protein [Burkholderiaceae bacterium]